MYFLTMTVLKMVLLGNRTKKEEPKDTRSLLIIFYIYYIQEIFFLKAKMAGLSSTTFRVLGIRIEIYN